MPVKPDDEPLTGEIMDDAPEPPEIDCARCGASLIGRQCTVDLFGDLTCVDCEEPDPTMH